MLIKDKEIIDKIDQFGRVVLSTDNFIHHLLNNKDLNGAYVKENEEYEFYMNSCDIFDYVPIKLKPYTELEQKYTKASYLKERSNKWLIPKDYFDIDIISHLINKCSNEYEKIRVAKELNEFDKRNQINVLYALIYMVDTMRENNIVWGIGRGSSVASFVLFLIGINKINPMDYDLDYDEFFK